MRRIFISLVSFVVVGCTEGVPKFTDLGSEFSQPTVSDVSKIYLISDLTSLSPAIEGTCDKNTRSIDLRPAGRAEFDEVATQVLDVSSDLNCQDGRFRLIVKEMGQYMGFTLSLAEQKTLTIRTRAEDGDSAEVDVFIRYLPTIPVIEWVSAPSVATVEGAYLNLELTISPMTPFGATVEYATRPGSAREGDDYLGSTGSLSFGAADSVLSISLPIYLDSLYENEESFVLSLSQVVGALTANEVLLVTISANGTPPSVVLGDLSISEGETFQFALSLSQLSGVDAVLSYQTYDGTAGSLDYTSISGQVTIREGQIATSIQVISSEDAAFEADETFLLSVTALSGVVIPIPGVDNVAIGTILNDDSVPQIQVSAQNSDEGDGMLFQASLSAPAVTGVVFSYQTYDGTAFSADSDYAPTSGTGTILSGQSFATITVASIEDTKFEASETVILSISGVTGATVSTPGVQDRATASILNDDSAPLLWITDRSINEGETSSLMVSLSQESGLEAVFSWRTFDGSALAGSGDYTSVALATVTIPAGSLTSGLVSFAALDDNLDEDSETASVSLTAVSGVAAGDLLSEITIHDINPAPLVFVEDVALTEPNTVPFVVSLSQVSGKHIWFNFSSVDVGSASGGGVDFNNFSSSRTILAGQLAITIAGLANAVEDLISESIESYQITLTSLNNVGVGRTGSQVQITDNDLPPSLFILGDTKPEGANLEFLVTLSGLTTLAVTFDFQSFNGSAVSASDYTAQNRSYTISAGSLALTIPLLTGNDSTFELDESFTVTVSNVSSNVTITNPGVDNSATGTIQNNDSSPLLFVSDASFNEDETAQFAVSLSAVSDLPVIFSWVTDDDGLAQEGVDYTAASGQGTIPAGALYFTIPVVALPADTLDEPLEDFSLDLAIVSFAGAGDLAARGEIIDNDGAPNLYITDLNLSEGDAGWMLVSLAAVSGLPVSFGYQSFSTGSGLSGADYTALSSTRLTIPAGTLTISFQVTSLEDTVFETNEYFDVSLSNITNAGMGDISGLVTIEEDDAQPILAIYDVSGAEGTTLAFKVSLSVASDVASTFSWVSYDNTATTADSDYSSTTGSGTIAAGSLQYFINLISTHDTKLENNENLYVSLSGLGNVSVVSAANLRATGTITNNDSSPLIYIDDLSLNEGQTQPVSISLSEVSGLETVFTWNTFNGVPATLSAASGFDYLGVTNQVVTIPAETRTIAINATAFADTLDEYDENYIISLSSLVNASAGDVEGLITIQDQNAEPALFISDLTLDEGEAGVIAVSLGQVSGRDLWFTYQTAHGTATAGDYSSIASTTVTIPAGALTVGVVISSTEDLLSEGDEVFNVSITSSAFASIIDNTSLVTITDDDGAVEIFISGDSNIEGTSLIFNVSLSGISAFNVTYDFNTLDGSAFTADADYSSSTASRVILAGSSLQTITISTGNDTKFENDETMQVILSNVVGANVNVGVATGTIQNNDSAPLLYIDDLAFNEGVTGLFSVSLSQISGLPVIFEWSTSDGTALQSNADYTPVTTTTVTVPAGAMTVAGVQAASLADNLDEYDETVFINLAIVSGGSVGDLSGTATILDQDDPPLLFIQDLTGVESSTLMMVASLSGISAKEVVFDYTTFNVVAMSGMDYSAISGRGTIAPFATQRSFDLVILDDFFAEGPETFGVTLSSVTNADVGRWSAAVTIADSDPQIELAVYDSIGIEGETLQFVVSLNEPAPEDMYFTWESVDGTAVSTDYQFVTSAIGTILMGSQAVTLSVITNPDVNFETDESFFVEVSGAPAYVNVLDFTGAGLIRNDDCEATGWCQSSFLKASNNGSSDFFGESVAIDNDTAAVAASGEDSNQTVVTNGSGASVNDTSVDSGAVYIFGRVNETWGQLAYLKASNNDANDYFGLPIDLTGDLIAVAAKAESSNQTIVTNGLGASANNSNLDSGAVYVFGRTGGTWAQQAYLKASNNSAGDQFGNSLAAGNDLIAVGSAQEDSNQTFITNGPFASVDNSASSSGAVYLFGRTNGTWVQQAYLKASNAEALDQFGHSVAVGSGVVAVGATGEDSNQTFVTNGSGASANNTNSGSGAVYIFGKSNGTWSQQAYLKASNNNVSDTFGNSLALDGETVVVGAVGEDSNQTTVTNGTTASSDNSASFSGAVYVFGRSNGTWTQQAYLKASNNGGNDQFGSRVGISGERIVVGVPGEDSNQSTLTNGPGASADNSNVSSGAVYVFSRIGGFWSQEAYFKASNSEATDNYGTSVAIDGDWIVVGATGEDSQFTGVNNSIFSSSDNLSSDSGAAYVYKYRGAIRAIVRQAPDQVDPAYSFPITWDVEFSRAIDPATFSVSDITLDPISVPASVTWNLVNSGDNKNYKLQATAASGFGLIKPMIAASVVTDFEGFVNLASSSYFDSDVTWKAPPSIFVTSTSATEGANLNFEVSLSEAVPFLVSFNASTYDQSATVADSDYTPINGTFVLPLWQRTQFVSVMTGNDSTFESNETMVISLSQVIGAQIANLGVHNVATGTIINDDSAPPVLSLSGAGGSTLDGVPVTACGGSGACNCANPYAINTAQVFSRIVMMNGACLTTNAYVGGAPAAGNGVLDIQVNGDFSISADSVISLSGRGYRGGEGISGAGQGNLTISAGGSHGGLGGNGRDDTTAASSFGSITQPLNLGGGSGLAGTFSGVGGGAIKIRVLGELILNGRIEANGANGTGNTVVASGGGAGGSIFVETVTLSGAGTLVAEGGTGFYANTSFNYGGGGAGGRIAVHYKESSSLNINNPNASTIQFYVSGAAPSFTGFGEKIGSSGSVYFVDTDLPNEGVFKTNTSLSTDQITPISQNLNLRSLHVEGFSAIDIEAGVTITTVTYAFSNNAGLKLTGRLNSTFVDGWMDYSFYFDGGEITGLIPGGAITIANEMMMSDVTLTLSEFHLEPAAFLRSDRNTDTTFNRVDIKTTGPGGIRIFGMVDVSGRGRPGGGTHVGAGQSFASGPGGAAGGSYGGYGGPGSNRNPDKTDYGSIFGNLTLGAGGGNAGSAKGGAGGGYIRLDAGSSTLQIGHTANGWWGNLSADGQVGLTNFSLNQAAGSGSGGGVELIAQHINLENGSLSARGGMITSQSSYYGGAGGGGRVFLKSASLSTGAFNYYLDSQGSTASWAAFDGGAGVRVFNNTATTDFTAYLENNSRMTYSESSLYAGGTGTVDLDWLFVNGGALARIPSGVNLTLPHPNLSVMGGTADFPSKLVIAGRWLEPLSLIDDYLVVENTSAPFGSVSSAVTIGMNGVFEVKHDQVITYFTDLFVMTGGLLTHTANRANNLYALNLQLNSLNLYGQIDVSGKGSSAGYGLGAGQSVFGWTSHPGGGGHGGAGGDSQWNYYFGGRSFGDVTLPVAIGSGGGYRFSNPATGGFEGAGGGRVKILANQMDLGNMGMISANGRSGSDGVGGGAGGSIALDVSGSLMNLMASSIRANGGDVWTGQGGAGAGGRIRAVVAGGLPNPNAFQVNGGSASGGGFAGSAGTIYYGPAQVQFRYTSTFATEPSFYNGMELVTDRPVPVSTNVQLATFNGAGLHQSEPQDYQVLNLNATISAGQTSTLVIVNILDDVIWEGGDYRDVFGLTITSVSSSLLLGANLAMTVTIQDAEQPVEISIEDGAAFEGTTAQIPIRFSHLSEAPIQLSFNAFGGTATSITDYSILTPALTSPPMSTLAQAQVTLSADGNTSEGLEYFNTLVADNASPTPLNFIRSNGSFTILDAPSTGRRIAILDSVTREGEAAIINLSLSGPGATAATGTVTINPGTAWHPDDFTGPLSFSFNLPPGVNTASFTVPTVDDFFFEPTEYFTANITGLSGAVTIDSSAIIAIKNREIVQISGSGFVTEGMSGNFQLNLSGSLDFATDVQIVAHNISAQNNLDYKILQTQVQIPPGNTSAPIPYQILGADKFEFNEVFVLSIASAPNLKIGGSGTITVTITNADPLVVESQYPLNGRKWNDYVKRDGTEWHNASDTPCAPILDSGGGGYRNCLHGGEHKVVRTGINSCNDLRFSDNLSALDWQCDDNGGSGPVNFYSYKLQNDKGLRDLIAGGGSSFNFHWMQFQLTQNSTGLSFWSASSQWWTNEVIALDSPMDCLDIKQEGAIYVTDNAISCQARIEADRVAVVTKGPNGKLVYDNSTTKICVGHISNFASCVLSSHDSRVGESFDFLWIEADIEADAMLGNSTDDMAWNGIYLEGSHFAVIRNSRVVGAAEANIHLVGVKNSWIENTYTALQQSNTYGGMSSLYRGGLALVGVENSTFFQVKSTNNFHRGLKLASSQENLFHKVILDGSEDDGIQGEGIRNTFKDITITNTKVRGMDLSSSDYNTWVNSFVSNVGSFGILLGSSSNANKFANLNMTHISSYNITMSSSATGNTFFGDIKFDDGNCSVDPGNVNPNLLSTCNETGVSDFDQFSNALNTANSFVDLVTIDNSTNFEDVNGQSPFSWLNTLKAWFDFETPFRTWALPNAINNPLAQGSCTSGTCQIRDLSLKPADTVLQNIYPQVVDGVACPAEWNGASSSQGLIITDQRSPANTFFTKADEILGDGEGDDDGLCESDEDCVQHRSFGIFQGDSDIDSASKCNFNDGVISDVKMLARVSYATFDFTQVGGGWSLSPDFQRASRNGTASAGNSRALTPKSSGKYYFEFLVDNSAGTANGMVGLVEASIPLSTNASGRNGSVVFFMNGQVRDDINTIANYYPNLGSTAPITNGTVIGFAVDLDLRMVWISINGWYFDGSGWGSNQPVAGQEIVYNNVGPMTPIVSANNFDTVSSYTLRTSPHSIVGRPNGFNIGWPK